jgi:hypothetical protein
MAKPLYGKVEIFEDPVGGVPPKQSKIILDPADKSRDEQTLVKILDKFSKNSILLNGTTHSFRLYDGIDDDFSVIKIEIDKTEGSRLVLGGGRTSPKSGFLTLLDIKGSRSIILNGVNGNITINDEDGKRSFALHGKLGAAKSAAILLGANSFDVKGPKPGYIAIRDVKGNDSIILDGAKGDIFLNNADCAEDFDVSKPDEIDCGTVVVIEEEGRLKKSTIAYDKRVAGVISGAGGYKPGIVLDKKNSNEDRKSVALMGKVYCKVEAKHSPIEVGDLLTTSSIAGYAMKATDPLNAFGAVIGKALRPLKSGFGMIPILIALQ